MHSNEVLKLFVARPDECTTKPFKKNMRILGRIPHRTPRDTPKKIPLYMEGYVQTKKLEKINVCFLKSRFDYI